MVAAPVDFQCVERLDTEVGLANWQPQQGYGGKQVQEWS